MTLEELLDESDLIQELKQHNTKLIEFLRDEKILKKLLEYVIAPKPEPLPPPPPKKDRQPDDDDDDDDDEEDDENERIIAEADRERSEKARLKYAFVSCEVLSSEAWSLLESLMQNIEHLQMFWTILERRSPLDPLQAGYFTKINETLLDKKTEEMMAFVKSLNGIVPRILRHVDCPMIMDLLLKIISMEKCEGGAGIVDVRYRNIDGFWKAQKLTWNAVATLAKPHSPSALVSFQRTQRLDSNRQRRFHQGSNHHLGQRFPERAVLHRAQRPHAAIGLEGMHRAPDI